MRYVIILFCVFSASALIGQDAAVFELPANGPKLQFEEAAFDFGDIEQGDVVEHTFAFENTGNQPLVISDVMTTCGCTVPAWPREPIVPGDKSEITVRFNSRGKIGIQNKIITVVSNGVNQRERIKITTNVKMPQSR